MAKAPISVTTVTPVVTPAVDVPFPLIVGVDVAKAEVVVAYEGQTDLRPRAVPNNRKALTRWLLSLPASSCIGLESTSRYHQLLTELAYAAGHAVYILNPKRIKKYREVVGERAKTDFRDAALIAYYLERHIDSLHPHSPLTRSMQKLNDLLHSRATVVKSQTQIHLSLDGRAGELDLGEPTKALMEQFKALLAAYDARIEDLLQQEGIQEKAKRLNSIVGFGTLTTAALIVAFERADFKTPDALIAFFGFDPRPRESGQFRGRRFLSKQGDSEVRRLLFNAARSAGRSEVWKRFLESYRKRGLSATQVTCILARKLLKIAWSINKNQTTFCRQTILDRYETA